MTRSEAIERAARALCDALSMAAEALRRWPDVQRCAYAVASDDLARRVLAPLTERA